MLTATPPLAGFFEAFARRITRAPVLTLAIIFAVTGVLGFFAARVKVNNSNEIFFVEDDPLLAAHRRFQKRFGSDSFVMVYVEGDLYAQGSFQAIDRLVDRMGELEYGGSPAFTGILSPFHAPTMRDGGGSIAIEPLLKNQDDPSPDELAKAKKDATQHPVYRDLLVSRDGTAGAVVGTLQALPGDDAYPKFIADEMRKLVDDDATLQGLGVLLVGDPIFKMQVDSATVEESATFGSAAILVSVLALWLMFRRKRQVAAAIGVVVLAVVVTIGAMSIVGAEFSLISIILPLVIVIMGLGSGVHIINEFREQRHRGHRRRESVVRALRETGLPCLLTAATTAVGFLSMLTAPVAPMRSLGIFASVGVLVSFLLAVTLVPAVLSLGDDAPDTSDPGAEAGDARSARWFSRLADLVVGHHRAVALIFVGLSLALGTGLKETRVESHVLQAFRKDQEFRQAVEHVDKKLGGSTSVELVVDSGVPRGVFDPGFLRRLDELQRWVQDTQGDVVGATLSLTDLLKEINYAFSGERKLPDSKDRAAQLMLLYEAGNGDARIVVDYASRRARISLRTRQTTTTRSLELEKALREKADALFADWQPPAAPAPAVETAPAPAASDDDDDEIVIIEDEAPAAARDAGKSEDEDEIVIIEDEEDAAADRPAHGADPAGAAAADAGPAIVDDPPLPPGAPRVELAGTSQLFVHLAEYVIDSQMTSFALAAAIISVLMVLMLRSLLLGLAVMIPNILPIVCTYGVMGWTGISVDWLTACVAVAALGVAVDGTIHIGTRYRLARLANHDAAAAARLVMTSIGRALVVTSVVLSVGFCVVAPSILASLARFGLLMALCLFLALLFDLLMTPAVLAWLSPGGRNE